MQHTRKIFIYFDGIKTFCLIKHSTCTWYRNEIL